MPVTPDWQAAGLCTGSTAPSGGCAVPHQDFLSWLICFRPAAGALPAGPEEGMRKKGWPLCRAGIEERDAFMSAISATGPLATLALPEERTARLVWQALLVLGGSLILALSAHVSVPFWPVPMTLQTLAVFALSALYGRNLAVATVLAYLVEGALGLPVFASGAGLAYLAGPTGGYLISYLFVAALIGHAADRGLDRNLPALFGVMLVGEAIVLLFGAAWLAVLFGPAKALAAGVGPFIVTDLVKTALAAVGVRAAVAMVRG